MVRELQVVSCDRCATAVSTSLSIFTTIVGDAGSVGRRLLTSTHLIGLGKVTFAHKSLSLLYIFNRQYQC